MQPAQWSLLRRLPKSSSRTGHILTQGPEHAVWTGTEADNVCCAEDETYDEANTYTKVNLRALAGG